MIVLLGLNGTGFKPGLEPLTHLNLDKNIFFDFIIITLLSTDGFYFAGYTKICDKRFDCKVKIFNTFIALHTIWVFLGAI